jgi:hypothetical protein
MPSLIIVILRFLFLGRCALVGFIFLISYLTFFHALWYGKSNIIGVFSHFSLLLGCALPKLMSSGLNDRPLAPFARILSLGIGDTMVSSASNVSYDIDPYGYMINYLLFIPRHQ